MQTSNIGNKWSSLCMVDVEFLPSKLEMRLYSFACFVTSLIIVGIGLGVAAKEIKSNIANVSIISLFKLIA